MKISLNGEATDTRGAQTVGDLVQRFELPPEIVLIEHNGVALHRRDWPQTALADGDQVEIIRVVAGG